MEKYKSIKLMDTEFDYLCIAKTYENPIQEFLTSSKVNEIDNGNVIFDLFVIHGNKNSRYVTASFYNNKIIPESIRKVENISDNIKIISKKYFMSNKSLIENSILPKAVKYMILH